MSETEQFPIGSTIETRVYKIGGRHDDVMGTVTEHRGKGLIVQTENHGTLYVERAKATRVTELNRVRL